MSLELDSAATYAEVRAALKPVAVRAPPLVLDMSQLKSEAKILLKNVARQKLKVDKLKGELTKIQKMVDRKHAHNYVTNQNIKNDLKSARKRCREEEVKLAEEKNSVKIL